MISRPPYGYVLPEGSKTYFDVQKGLGPETEQNLQDGRDHLEEMLNYAAVAPMFNARNVPGGTSRRKEDQDGAAIKRLYHNPILKGQRDQPCRASHWSSPPMASSMGSIDPRRQWKRPKRKATAGVGWENRT